MGELRKPKPWSTEGKAKRLPAGCVIEFKAIGTRAQNADCHDTVLVLANEVIAAAYRDVRHGDM